MKVLLAAVLAAAVVGYPVPNSPMCDYINIDNQCIEAPDGNPGNFHCCDGTWSHATHRNGACSHHLGIC